MEKKDHKTRSRDGSTLDWELLVEPYRDRWEWLLERATAISENYPDELDAIERVRAYAFEESRRRPSAGDVLLVLGIVISLFDRDVDFDLPGDLFADAFPHWVGPTHRLCA